MDGKTGWSGCTGIGATGEGGNRVDRSTIPFSSVMGSKHCAPYLPCRFSCLAVRGGEVKGSVPPMGVSAEGFGLATDKTRKLRIAGSPSEREECLERRQPIVAIKVGTKIRGSVV